MRIIHVDGHVIGILAGTPNAADWNEQHLPIFSLHASLNTPHDPSASHPQRSLSYAYGSEWEARISEILACLAIVPVS